MGHHEVEMSDPQPIRAKIRRWYVPNAIYFITAVTHERRPIFADDANIELLRATMRKAKKYHPFRMHAYALMPDHFHLLIYVPASTNISKLMQSIQWNFTRSHKAAHGVTTSVKLWQRGFWDHVIRDDNDFERHFDYIHYNPVKHGYVTLPADYAHSSFLEYVRLGWYGPSWAVDVKLDVSVKHDFE
jgi:putative transposase